MSDIRPRSDRKHSKAGVSKNISLKLLSKSGVGKIVKLDFSANTMGSRPQKNRWIREHAHTSLGPPLYCERLRFFLATFGTLGLLDTIQNKFCAKKRPHYDIPICTRRGRIHYAGASPHPFGKFGRYIYTWNIELGVNIEFGLGLSRAKTMGKKHWGKNLNWGWS